jgi:uncharacterized protein YceH (UPF0502 family)
MHIGDLTAPERRVLGCLIEKRFATPDQYPLTLNSLRLAANQSTGRDPIVDYDAQTVQAAAQRLCQYGLARLASGQGSRAVKYRHLAAETLALNAPELGLLAVLMLRGPQTPGELKSRSERLAPLPSLAAVQEALQELIARGYVRRLPRQPGQKEARFRETLGVGGDDDDAEFATVSPSGPTTSPSVPLVSPSEPVVSPTVRMAAPSVPMAVPSEPVVSPYAATAPVRRAPVAGPMPGPATADHDGLEVRVSRLEDELRELRSEFAALREALGG